MPRKKEDQIESPEEEPTPKTPAQLGHFECPETASIAGGGFGSAKKPEKAEEEKPNE